MTLRIQRAHQHFIGAAVRLVFALALFVLDDAALLVELGLSDGAEQEAHAVRFHEQRGIERGGRNILEVVGAVGIGGSVLVGDANLLEGFEVFALVVFRTLEHQVLEQVREARPARRLVLGADVIPQVDRDDGRLAVGVNDDAQAVGQGELLVGDVNAYWRRGRHRGRCWQPRRERDSEDEGAETGLAQRLGHGAPGNEGNGQDWAS
jgi:hypothetical protein